MKSFTSHRGMVVTLDRANVDTDQVIPKQFLKSIVRTGFGEQLFYDWRYLPSGQPNPAFVLNTPRFHGATILVTRGNFGCGSSREHAVWSIQQYGFAVVIAPWQQLHDSRVPAFADIFRNNSAKNGLLTVELSASDVEEIFQLVEHHEGLEASVDLEQQEVRLHTSEERVFQFDIDSATKERLITGQDDIALTLRYDEALAVFEATHDPQLYG